MCETACVCMCYKLQCWQGDGEISVTVKLRGHCHETEDDRTISIMHLALWKGWAREGMHSIFCQAVGGGIVSLLPHYADVMHHSLQEALKERAERAECVWEIRRVQMNLQSWLKEGPGARIFMTSHHWYGEVFRRSPVGAFVDVWGVLLCRV